MFDWMEAEGNRRRRGSCVGDAEVVMNVSL